MCLPKGKLRDCLFGFCALSVNLEKVGSLGKSIGLFERLMDFCRSIDVDTQDAMNTLFAIDVLYSWRSFGRLQNIYNEWVGVELEQVASLQYM